MPIRLILQYLKFGIFRSYCWYPQNSQMLVTYPDIHHKKSSLIFVILRHQMKHMDYICDLLGIQCFSLNSRSDAFSTMWRTRSKVKYCSNSEPHMSKIRQIKCLNKINTHNVHKKVLIMLLLPVFVSILSKSILSSPLALA